MRNGEISDSLIIFGVQESFIYRNIVGMVAIHSCIYPLNKYKSRSLYWALNGKFNNVPASEILGLELTKAF